MTFCARDKNCIAYDSFARMPGLAYSSPLCVGCVDSFRGIINSLRYDYVDLTQLLPKADGRNEVGKIFRPKPESMPPLSMVAFYLRADIAYLVGAVHVHLLRHLGPPAHGKLMRAPTREGYRLDRETAWLADRVNELASMPATTAVFLHSGADDDEAAQTMTGLELLETLAMLHRKARRTCGTAPAVVSLPGFCPACGAVSLQRHDDDTSKIWCRACSHKLSGDDYSRLARLHLPGA